MRATGEHSLSTRLSSWFGTITLGTRLIFILCVSIFLFGFVYGFRGFLYCMQPASVAGNYGKAYTFILSGIFHINALHLVFNMMSWCPMGSNFERSIGTIPFLYLMFSFDWLGSFLHFIFASILHYSHTYPYFYYSCSAGLSGVIFSLLTIECNTNEGNRSCFGFNIPSRLYPFLLLFIIQLVYGEASFLGHFSGIVVGYLYNYGLLNWMIPSKVLDRIEVSRLFRPLVSLNGFILRPSSFSLPVSVSLPSSASATVSSWTTPATEAFSGQGRVLGSSIKETPSAPPESPILDKQ